MDDKSSGLDDDDDELLLSRLANISVYIKGRIPDLLVREETQNQKVVISNPVA